MKQAIDDIIQKYNPKSFGKIITASPALNQPVNEYIQLNKLENIAEAVYCIHYAVLPVKCPCGEKALFNTFIKGYRKFCSFSCTAKGKAHSHLLSAQWEDQGLKDQMLLNKKKTNLQKYGAENAMSNLQVQQKVARTNQQKYGSKSPLSNAIVQQKIKESCQERYGVNYPFQSTLIRQKGAATFIENHGFQNDMSLARAAFQERHGKNPFQLASVQQQTKDTLLLKYGVDHPMKCPAILERSRDTLFGHYGKNNPAQLHLSDTVYAILQSPDKLRELLKSPLSEITKTYRVSRSLIMSYHNRYGLDIIKQRVRSGYEEEIATILDGFQVKYHRNYNKLCYPQQVDFYIPDHNLAIEFNGLYWHSENSGSKNKNYHAEKFNKCADQKIQLITIFEDEWLIRPGVIINKLKHLCGKTTDIIGARKVELSVVTDPDAVRNFLETYHLQGKTEGVSIALQGKVNGEVISMMTLRGGEITRFCTDNTSSYPGLFSKFLSFIKKNSDLKIVTTIADLRWGSGEVYMRTGFTVTGRIKPDYQYTDYHRREHKFNYRKDKISRKYGISTEFTTEKEMMESLGFDRIWDCGKIKFELVL